MWQEHLRYIVDKNIICADALRYRYRFDGTDPYKTEQDSHNEKLFEIGCPCSRRSIIIPEIFTVYKAKGTTLVFTAWLRFV